jgi:hypothetical protein
MLGLFDRTIEHLETLLEAVVREIHEELPIFSHWKGSKAVARLVL